MDSRLFRSSCLLSSQWRFLLYFSDVILLFLVTSSIGKVSASAPGEEGDRCCSCPTEEHNWEAASEVDVVVVGGGVAGLAALSTLLQHNITNVVLLEAQDRLGGRVRTYRQDGIVVEDGAEWIHGDERNPLYRIATSLGALQTYNLPDDQWDFYVVTEEGLPVEQEAYDLVMALMNETIPNGVLKPYYNTSYGEFFLDRFTEMFPADTPQREAILHYLHQLVMGLEGVDTWQEISAEDVDQYVCLGEDYVWKDGYDTLIRHLTERVPESVIHLSSPVSRIVWNCRDLPAQALVVTGNGSSSFLARHVLVTASSAYLQQHHQSLFIPRLPDTFLHTLSGVKLGVANKIQLGWSKPWWGQKLLDLNIMWTQFNLPHNMSWLYGVVSVFSLVRQKEVVELLVAGDNSRHMEELPEDEVKAHVLHLLTNATGKAVPQPNFFRRTQWSKDPWTLGSYATLITLEGLQAGVHDRAQLATPIDNQAGHTVLLWAGEHTHDTRYGTVDGALETGQREAQRLIHLLRKPS